MTVIDAHHHVWDLGARDQPWIDPVGMAAIRRDFDLDDLARLTGPAGVTGTELVQTDAVAAETRELLVLAEGSDLVAGVVGWVDLTAPDVAEVLAELRAAPGGDRLVGVRHLVQGEPDPWWLARADVRRGLPAVADAGLTFDLLVRPHQLPAATDAARALPQLRFILDHLAKPPIAAGLLEPWAARIGELAACRNVAAKLSGLVTEANWTGWRAAHLRPYTQVALDTFGPGRLMFGSDWPVCLLAGSYAQVLAAVDELVAVVSEAERAAVFAGTARTWYRLGASC